MAKQCIGLDIGSSAVKAVQLKRKSTGWALQAFGMQPLVPQTIVDGTIMDQSAVSDAIRQLWGRLKLRMKDVAIALAGHSVIIKKITVPMMKPDELAMNIRNEAEHHIPFGRDDVEIDYHVTNPMTASGQTELLLVAAKKEVVSDYVQVVRDAGLFRRSSMSRRSRARTASRRTTSSMAARRSCSSTSAPRSRTSTSCAAACRCSRAT